ncbi:MAG: Gfo/Idh/MocA family protein [Chloroflexota bacterium]
MASENGKVLRVAQIGCGQISTAHLKAYAESGLVDLAVVVDVDPVAAQEAAAANGGVPWTTDFEKAVGQSDVDLVSIATPHHLHAPQTIAAAHAGKHVLCEKPLTTSIEAADAMLAACRDNGVKLGVWFVSRYSAVFRAARALLRAGAIGDVVNIRLPDVHNKVPDYYQRGVGGRARPSQWRGSQATSGGGALIMNAIHQIDVLRYVTGLEVQRVSAEWINFTGLGEVEDMIAVLLRYSNGAIGSIETANYAPGGGEPSVLRIYGSKGQFQIARGGLRAFVEQPVEGIEGLPALQAKEWQDVPTAQTGDGRTHLLEDFARAVQAGQEPPVTGEDGRAAVEIVLAAYQSAAAGQSVTLPLATAKPAVAAGATGLD